MDKDIHRKSVDYKSAKSNCRWTKHTTEKDMEVLSLNTMKTRWHKIWLRKDAKPEIASKQAAVNVQPSRFKWVSFDKPTGKK
jgi:hypothetical protein